MFTSSIFKSYSKHRNSKIITFVLFTSVISIVLFLSGMFKVSFPSDKINEQSYSKPLYNKLIFILLDGLRIDGLVKTEHNQSYHNNFKFLQNLDPSKKHLFLSIAGMPTSTSTRVKSILTGYPSNFLNGLFTFTHRRIQYDNFIKKLNLEQTFFYGDQTWVDIFPELTPISSTIDSYDKESPFDLEIQKMNQMIDNLDKYKYNLGHFIYLDHYGHEYGIESEQVKNVMIEYDKMLEKVYNKMDDDTLLVIYSDHGVNQDGTHGGSGRNELSSICGFLSKKELTFKNEKEITEIRENFLKGLYRNDTAWIKSLEDFKMMHQDDIMPTVCTLMGLPLPYVIMGNVIYEFFDDETLPEQLYKHKCRILGKKEKEINGIKETIQAEYDLNPLIYEKYSGSSFFQMFSSLLLLGIGFCMLIFSHLSIIKTNYKIFFTVFCIFMLSHSVTCTINEDIWWLFSMVSSLNIKILLIALYIIKVGRYPQEEYHRMFYTNKVSESYENRHELIIIITITLILNIFTMKKNFPRKNILNKSFFTRIFKILLKYYSPKFFLDLNCCIFFENPSIENLNFQLFNPSSLFFMFFLRNMLNNEDITIGYAINYLYPFVIGMNHELSSINYNSAFKFSKKFDIILGSSCVFYFILYPRIHILKKIIESRKYQNIYFYIMLSTFHLMISLGMALFCFKSLIFHNFFGQRFFFICFYYVADMVLLGLILLSIKFKSYKCLKKQKKTSEMIA